MLLASSETSSLHKISRISHLYEHKVNRTLPIFSSIRKLPERFASKKVFVSEKVSSKKVTEDTTMSILTEKRKNRPLQQLYCQHLVNKYPTLVTISTPDVSYAITCDFASRDDQLGDRIHNQILSVLNRDFGNQMDEKPARDVDLEALEKYESPVRPSQESYFTFLDAQREHQKRTDYKDEIIKSLEAQESRNAIRTKGLHLQLTEQEKQMNDAISKAQIVKLPLQKQIHKKDDAIMRLEVKVMKVRDLMADDPQDAHGSREVSPELQGAKTTLSNVAANANANVRLFWPLPLNSAINDQTTSEFTITGNGSVTSENGSRQEIVQVNVQEQDRQDEKEKDQAAASQGSQDRQSREHPLQTAAQALNDSVNAVSAESTESQPMSTDTCQDLHNCGVNSSDSASDQRESNETKYDMVSRKKAHDVHVPWAGFGEAEGRLSSQELADLWRCRYSSWKKDCHDKDSTKEKVDVSVVCCRVRLTSPHSSVYQETASRLLTSSSSLFSSEEQRRYSDPLPATSAIGQQLQKLSAMAQASSTISPILSRHMRFAPLHHPRDKSKDSRNAFEIDPSTGRIRFIDHEQNKSAQNLSVCSDDKHAQQNKYYVELTSNRNNCSSRRSSLLEQLQVLPSKARGRGSSTNSERTDYQSWAGGSENTSFSLKSAGTSDQRASGSSDPEPRWLSPTHAVRRISDINQSVQNGCVCVKMTPKSAKSMQKIVFETSKARQSTGYTGARRESDISTVMKSESWPPQTVTTVESKFKMVSIPTLSWRFQMVLSTYKSTFNLPNCHQVPIQKPRPVRGYSAWQFQSLPSPSAAIRPHKAPQFDHVAKDVVSPFCVRQNIEQESNMHDCDNSRHESSFQQSYCHQDNPYGSNKNSSQDDSTKYNLPTIADYIKSIQHHSAKMSGYRHS